MNRKTLRNGVWTGSGLGTQYRIVTGVLYLDKENGDVDRWDGTRWVAHFRPEPDPTPEPGSPDVGSPDVGSPDIGSPEPGSPTTTPASAPGTRIPFNASSITDHNGDVYTKDASNNVLKNGASWHGAWGSQVLWWGDEVLHKGVSTGEWYEWNEGTQHFDSLGTDDPQFGPPPPIDPPPSGDLPEAATTGTINISVNPNLLIVASATGINVGDWLIVPVGWEPGLGLRGTKGVGGNWPSVSRASLAVLQADTSLRQEGRFVWVEDTGDAYRYVNAQWIPAAIWGFYVAKSVPKAYQAKVLQKDGNRLIMDRPALISVTNADVYVDAAPYINALPANTMVPSGEFAIGGEILRSDFLIGQGKTLTHFYAPPGVPGLSCVALNPGHITKDIKFTSNYKHDGFGLYQQGSTTPYRDGSSPQGRIFWIPINDFDIPQGAFPKIVSILGGATGAIVEDCEFVDPASWSVWMQANNAAIRRLHTNYTVGLFGYIQWTYNSVNGDGHLMEDCTITSPKLVPGFESFAGATNCIIRRCGGTNCTVSFNAAGGWLLEDYTATWTADSDPGVPFSGMCIAVTAAGVQTAYLGGTMRRLTLVQEGYLNAAGQNAPGIVIGQQNPKVRIETVSFTAPDYNPGTGKGGAQGIISIGFSNDSMMRNNPGTFVSNLNVTGLPKGLENQANIYVEGPNITDGGGNNPDPRTLPGQSHASYGNPYTLQGSKWFANT